MIHKTFSLWNFIDKYISVPEPRQSYSAESLASSASTIPYVDEEADVNEATDVHGAAYFDDAPYVIHISTSTATVYLDSDDDDEISERGLETHFYVPEREPAPFSESFHEHEINNEAGSNITEEIGVETSQISLRPWVKFEEYLFHSMYESWWLKEVNKAL